MTDDEIAARLAWSRKQMLKRNKNALANRADEMIARREAYEERAGIWEFDAGMSRADAEKMAATFVSNEYDVCETQAELSSTHKEQQDAEKVLHNPRHAFVVRLEDEGLVEFNPADDDEAEFTMGADK